MKSTLGKVARRLDTPLGRPLLAALIAAVSLRTRGGWTRAHWRDGLWFHATPDGVIVDRYANFSATQTLYRALAHDYWGQHYTPRAGDVVIDVGAGVGTEVAWLAPAVRPDGAVIAIEAHPQTFAALDAFCTLNGYTNVTRLQVAVHDSDAAVWLDDPDAHVASSMATVDGRQSPAGQAAVQVAGSTLDALLAPYTWPTIAYIKVNIEGAEVAALRGMAQTLARTQRITVACHDFRAAATGEAQFRTRAAVSAALVAAGFTLRPARADARPWVRDQVNAVRANG